MHSRRIGHNWIKLRRGKKIISTQDLSGMFMLKVRNTPSTVNVPYV